MEYLATPKALNFYVEISQLITYGKLIYPQIFKAPLHLAQTSDLFHGVPPEILTVGYAEESIASSNYSNMHIVGIIALFTLGLTVRDKFNDRSISLWKSFIFEHLPVNACTYLPALAVKGAFFLGAHRFSNQYNPQPRSTVDRSKRHERIALVVMTVALSSFVIPPLYTKLRGQTTVINNQGLAKYFAIQCIWHLAIEESFGLIADAMRESIQANTHTQWKDLFFSSEKNIFGQWKKAPYTLGHTAQSYGLEKALISSLTPDDFDSAPSSSELASLYFTYKEKFQSNSTLNQKLKVTLEKGFPSLFIEEENIPSLTVDSLTITDDNTPFWEHFYNTHQETLREKNPHVLLMLSFALFGVA